MSKVPVVGHDAVLATISPAVAIEATRRGFVEHALGNWHMPPKVYVESPPHGDFRAMPALGDGIALLKWVTSFPGNPERGLPTVTGMVLLNDATTGEPLALIDGRAVTALRTGAAAAVATVALASSTATTVGLIGCGLHGRWAARCLTAAGYRDGVCFDRAEAAARSTADEVGWRPGSMTEALACDVVVTVTPGHEPVVTEDDLRPGLHLNALGADGPGKAEFTIDAVAGCRLFCDEWTQASHGGELTGAVEAGRITAPDVTDLGLVLAGKTEGRTTDDEITLFDSTGLAIQDLAIAIAVLERAKAGSVETTPLNL